MAKTSRFNYFNRFRYPALHFIINYLMLFEGLLMFIVFFESLGYIFWRPVAYSNCIRIKSTFKTVSLKGNSGDFNLQVLWSLFKYYEVLKSAISPLWLVFVLRQTSVLLLSFFYVKTNTRIYIKIWRKSPKNEP